MFKSVLLSKWQSAILSALLRITCRGVIESTLLLITMLVYIVPSFVGGLLEMETAYTMFYMRDKIVIFLLTCFICNSLPRKSPFTRGLCVLMLIATLYYLANFWAVEVGEEAQYNWVSGNG